MKTLVILTDNFLPRRDGISRFLSEVIPRIKDTYKIHLVCPDYGKIEGFASIQITKIPLSKKQFGDYAPATFKPVMLYNVIKKADIVFSQTIGPVGGLGLFISHMLGKKTISYIHSVDWELFSKAARRNWVKKHAPAWTKRLDRFLYGQCKELIVPSERIADMLTWQGINKQKTVIHLGVDTQRFKKRDGHQLRAKLGFENTDVVIGYHGRIAREKDIPTLVRAFVKLRRKHKEAKLLIVGNGIKKIIDQLKKQPGVVYVPGVDDVEHYLNAMDIYCLPSLTETTSLSTLEAMSSELPVVCTEVGFVRDYVKEGINGYFFKTGNSHELATKLEYLLSHTYKFKELGHHGRKLVQEHFDWDVTAERLSNFFAANT